MPESQFPHLRLLFKEQGVAKLEGGGKSLSEVQYNQENRDDHSGFLISKAQGFSNRAKELRASRQKDNLPEIKGGVPFLIKIPDGDDGSIEFIAEKLGLEVVAEYDDGFLIVASEDLDLQRVLDLARDFATAQRGSGNMARILEVDDDPLSEKRIKRILEDGLFEKWPFSDEEILTLDVSIEVAAFGQPSRPRITSRMKDETKAVKQIVYEREEQKYLQVWDEKRRQRENEVEEFAKHYQGQICSITDDSNIVKFPDSFSVRICMNGKGFKDLILNYPNLFEVVLPDDFESKAGIALKNKEPDTDFELLSPPEGSPSICIIDSGIQENHRWLAGAIDDEVSRCFIPGKDPKDVADHVDGGGHGTRVAGACLYPQEVIKQGKFQALFWLLNARVLNEGNILLDKIFPAELLQKIVAHYKELRGAKIFQHSIGARCCCRLSRMSIWASAIDLLSYEEDVLFIQSAGNLAGDVGTNISPSILEHIQQGRSYPHYLYEPSSRISNPAQSLQALTVGSISAEYYKDSSGQSVSPARNPSSFSRSGFGMWHSIKPEIVEFGGDDFIGNASPPLLTNPEAVCPELIRSTIKGGPAYAKDVVGSSFAAPKITHIAGRLAALFPTQSSLLYRALIVNSARWPVWAENVPVAGRVPVVRSIGYGVPDVTRATENTETRITLITEEVYDIKAKEGFIFGIPIPQELRKPGEDFRVRIDVTLSYSGNPRRTRKSRRGYLGVWLDWKASKKGEAFETFRSRALRETEGGDGVDDGNFSWTIGNKRDRDGETDGVSRRNGTVQKDWTVANSYELPDIFGIVVRGHEGWDRHNPNAISRFALVVSFEVLGTDIKIYETIRTAVRQEIDAGRVMVRA